MAPHPDPSQPFPDVPREIGGCQIQRILGAGGMAVVYAALQRQPRRTVAVKVVRGAANAEIPMRRFRREIEILGRLRHPGIAQIFDAGIHEDERGRVPYFVMEYVPRAKTIIEHAEARELSLRDRLKLFVKVCAAVEHGHDRKVVHRDLKPGNILIDERGEPKVIDFGLAWACELGADTQVAQAEERRIIGTISYMAPEQLQTPRRDLDPRCDVYALGVLLFQLLTARLPHELHGLPVREAARIVREEPVPRPGSIRPDLRGDLEMIILTALARDPAGRYRTAGGLGRDVLRFLGHRPVRARPAGRLHRLRLLARRRRTEVVAVAAVALVIVAAATVIGVQRALLAGGGHGAESQAAARAGGSEPDRSTPPAPGPFTDAGPTGAAAASPTTIAPPSAATAAPPPGVVPAPFTLSGLGAEVTSLAFDGEGRRLAAGGADGSIVVWNLATRTVALRTHDHEGPVRHLRFAAGGGRVVSAGDDRVAVVSSDDGVLEAATPHHLDAVLAMDASADGTLVALAGADLTVRLFETRGRERQVLRGTRGVFHAVAFDHSGARVAAGSERGGVYVWDAGTGALIASLHGLRGDVIAVGFTAADDAVVAMTANGAGRRWRLGHDHDDEDARDDQNPDADGEGGERMTIASSLGDLTAAALDPAGRQLVCISAERIEIIDLQTGGHVEPLLPTLDEAPARTVALSADTRRLAIGSTTGTVYAVPFTALR